MALSTYPKFSVQPVELLMERADLTEICLNKRLTFGGTSLSPFLAVKTEEFHNISISSLICCLLVSSRKILDVPNETESWTEGKILFIFMEKGLRNFPLKVKAKSPQWKAS